MQTRYLVPLLLVHALFTVSCDDPVESGELGLLEPLTPTQLTATVGSTLPEPFTVRALTVEGAPLEGVAVDWSATAGQLSETTTITDETGRASVVFTVGVEASLGGDGELVFQAVTADAEGVDPVLFSVDAQAGPPVEVRITPDSLHLEAPGDTATIDAVLLDEFGNQAAMTLSPVFTSLDRNVATIDGDGLVEAVAVGTTEVAAATSTAADTIPVVVGSGG